MNTIALAIIFASMTYMMVKSDSPKNDRETMSAGIFTLIWALIGILTILGALFGK